MSAYLRGFTYLLLLPPGQATHQVAARARRIKSIHPNSLARQEHLGSIDPGCLADQDYRHITMLNSTATRSGPLQLPATSKQYMFFEALSTRQQYYNDHLNYLTSFIDLATIRETTHTNDFARFVSCATTRSKGLKRFRLRRRCREAWRECAYDCAYERCCDVARVISLATTRSREIVFATAMSQGSRSQMILQGSERFCLRQRCHKDYRPCNKKVIWIKVIVLTTTKGQVPSLLSRLRQVGPTRKSNVTRFIALKTTRLREIRIATLMSRDSERTCSQGQCHKTVVSTTRSREMATDCARDTDVARFREITLERASLSSSLLSLSCLGPARLREVKVDGHNKLTKLINSLVGRHKFIDLNGLVRINEITELLMNNVGCLFCRPHGRWRGTELRR